MENISFLEIRSDMHIFKTSLTKQKRKGERKSP